MCENIYLECLQARLKTENEKSKKFMKAISDIYVVKRK
jgi:hypothetical protein